MVRATVDVLRYAYQEAKDILQVQSGSLVNLRNNASTLLGFGGVILGLGVAGFTFLTGRVGPGIAPNIAVALFASGMAAIVASASLAMWCLLPKQLIGGLPATRLVEVMDYDITEPDFIAQAVRAYGRFITANSRILESTAKAQSRATWGLLAGVVLYTAAGGVLLYLGG